MKMEVKSMRYENLKADSVDPEYIQLSDDTCQGNIALSATDELIDIVNEIRRVQGNVDLVTEDDDNDVYYNFYLGYDTAKREVSLEASCNHGEKDDFACYNLPMTDAEKESILYQTIGMLSAELIRQ